MDDLMHLGEIVKKHWYIPVGVIVLVLYLRYQQVQAANAAPAQGTPLSLPTFTDDGLPSTASTDSTSVDPLGDFISSLGSNGSSTGTQSNTIVAPSGYVNTTGTTNTIFTPTTPTSSPRNPVPVR